MTGRTRHRIAVATVAVAVLAAGTAATVERESAARTVVADCAHPTGHLVAASWRLNALKTAGCQMWNSAHHHRRHGHRRPARTRLQPRTRTVPRAV
jgi:hypothetical protein